MHWLIQIFGEGKELTLLQMSARSLVVFFAALAMLRVTGQRTIGSKSAFDLVVIIMLGAILSRAVTGSSPFIPVMGASFMIVLLHRLLGWASLYNDMIGGWVKGNRVLLFKDNKPQKANMKDTLVSHKDVMEGVRLQANQDDTKDIEEIYMERSGEISVVKKH